MKNIILNNERLEYTIKRSAKARYMRLAVRSDSSVVVTLPWHIHETLAEKFVREKALWLTRKINQLKNRTDLILPGGSRSYYLKNKTTAIAFIKERLGYFITLE